MRQRWVGLAGVEGRSRSWSESDKHLADCANFPVAPGEQALAEANPLLQHWPARDAPSAGSDPSLWSMGLCEEACVPRAFRDRRRQRRVAVIERREQLISELSEIAIEMTTCEAKIKAFD
jgi:hypothetical protein